MIILNYLLVCLIFGTTFLAIKIGVDVSAPPFLSAGIRFFIAGGAIIRLDGVEEKSKLFAPAA